MRKTIIIAALLLGTQANADGTNYGVLNGYPGGGMSLPRLQGIDKIDPVAVEAWRPCLLSLGLNCREWRMYLATKKLLEEAEKADE